MIGLAHVGVGIRCFGERFDALVTPLKWKLTAALIGTPVSRSACVIIGPLSISAVTYNKTARSFDGPALAFYCGWGGWQYELRLVPFLWRLRRKPGFISVGPLKLMSRPLQTQYRVCTE